MRFLPLLPLVLLIMMCGKVDGVFSFPVFRTLQRVGAAGAELGSRGASLSLPASLTPLPRHALIVRFEQVSDLAALCASSGAVIVVVPPNGTHDSETIERWGRQEAVLLDRAVRGIGCFIFPFFESSF